MMIRLDKKLLIEGSDRGARLFFRRPGRLRTILLATPTLAALSVPINVACAADGTWLATPANGNFNNGANWSPAGVPDGNAIFGASNTTAISFTANTQLGGLLLNANAVNYTFDISANGSNLAFLGNGIVINGGSATLNNSGTLSFFAASSAGAATINNTGVLAFAENSNAGTARINNGDVAEVRFIQNSSAGQSTITSSGFIEFFDSSTAGNATITSSGSVAFRDNSVGTSARIILDNGTLDISALGITGTSLGSVEGTGTISLGGKILDVGSTNRSSTFSGVIQGLGGSLIKTGNGTLVLTGNNTFNGLTQVSGGTLQVDGSIAASNSLVLGNGTLAGSGTVANTTITGGTLAPGSGAIGTLKVQGDLNFDSASTYLVRVSPASASRTDVSGSATLGNAAVTASFAPGSYVAKRYTILNAAGGATGTFGTLASTNLPANFVSSLSYDANNAFLDLKLDFTGAPPTPGTPGDPSDAPNFGDRLSSNQRNVANALVNSFNTAGGIPLVFGALTPEGLTRIAGETATATQQATFDAMGMFIGLMTDPTLDGRGNSNAPTSRMQYAGNDDSSRNRISDAYAAIARKAPPANIYSPRWSVWAAGFGGSQTTSGNTALGSNDTRSSLFGVAVGADYYFSPKTVAGYAIAGGGSSFSVANGGSGRSDLFQLGAFIRHTEGAAFVTAALAYGWQDVTTDRTLNLAGVDQLRAQFNANALSGRLEGGYRLSSNGFGLTPYAAGQVTTYMLPSYAEQAVSGTDLFALAYGARDVTAARSELGFRTEKTFALTDSWLTLRSRLAWAHDFNQDRSISAVFQTLPGSAFVVNGARPAADSALTTASAEIAWRNGWSAIATFEGQFSETTNSYAGKGLLRYSW